MLLRSAGDVALIALGAIESAGIKDRLPVWLIPSLLRRWVDGTYQGLRLVASFPLVESVPNTLVPAADRLNIAEVDRRHAIAEKGYMARLASARASSEDVYPPIPQVDD